MLFTHGFSCSKYILIPQLKNIRKKHKKDWSELCSQQIRIWALAHILLISPRGHGEGHGRRPFRSPVGIFSVRKKLEPTQITFTRNIINKTYSGIENNILLEKIRIYYV